MWRVALTGWFTLTALLGPGVCCCSVFANPCDHPVVPTAPQQTVPETSKPYKSCCERTAAEPNPTNPDTTPSKPSDRGPCPCKQGKQLHESLPVVGTQVSTIKAKLFEPISFGWLTAASLATPRLQADTSPTPVPDTVLSGRALLSVYHILRC